MKNYVLPGLLLSILIQIPGAKAQILIPKDTVLEHMQLANNYFMGKWPDPGADIVTDRARPSNLWTRAAYYEGLMALYSINKDENLYNYAVAWSESHDWKPTYGILDTRDGDHQCCGQTYIELYRISKNPKWIVPITKNINNMVDDDKNDDWSWIDAIQMSMPVFAKLGVIYEDTNYFDKMYKLYSYTKCRHGENGLYNREDHLWWRDGDFDPPVTTPNGKQLYWSRGNGWVYAALVRVLSIIPENETHRKEYLSDFLEMTDALVVIQRDDGFWNTSLVDPEHYGGKETSGTAFFVYGLAWGINNGFLDVSRYLPHVVAGWEGMIKYALHPDGMLGWVQSTGKEPKEGQPLSYDKPANFEDFGLGAFLLAGSEVYKLASPVSELHHEVDP
jgi:rhamnogalacturonyl hydrolase YesR